MRKRYLNFLKLFYQIQTERYLEVKTLIVNSIAHSLNTTFLRIMYLIYKRRYIVSSHFTTKFNLTLSLTQF